MEELDIKEFIEILLEKKWLIIIVTLICMIVGYTYNSCITTPLYKSSTTLLLAKTATENASIINQEYVNQAITQTDITLNEKLVSTYSELAKSSGILSKVITNLNLNMTEEQIKKNITISEVDNTEILKVTVANTNSKQAATIANELALVFSERIKDLYNIDNIKVVDIAVATKSPYNIQPKKYGIIGAGIGFVASVVFVLFMNLIKNTARTAKQVERNTNISVLATISKDKSTADELTTFVDNRSSITESFKGLRTNIKFYKKEKIKSIAITSSVPEEGKSWISSNLATIFAKNGEKVLLIDADMRRGRQHSIFDVKQKNGLSELLKTGDIENIGEYIQKTNINNLHILTCGELTQDSSELLLTNIFEKAVEILESYYDMVIIDTTPNSIVTDGTIISRLVDTNIIVTKYNHTDLETIDRIKDNIKKVGGDVLGLVINQIPNPNKKYDNSYYYYTTAMIDTGRKYATRAARLNGDYSEEN